MNVRKRGLALVMCICMLLTLMPMSVLADEAPAPDVVNGQYNENGEWEQSDNGGSITYNTEGKNTLKLSKTAEKADGDNTYKITLKVESSQSTMTTPPGAAATVLVIDVSGSMGFCAECGAEKSHLNNCKHYNNKDNSVKTEQTRLKAAQNAAISFLDSYKGNTNGTGRYVSLVKFESESSVVKEWFDVSTAAGYNEIKTAINSLKADGGTNLDAALRTANSQFTASAVSTVASKNVVALTDGIPTFYGDGTSQHGNYGCPDTNAATAASASTLRNTASVYTVCFGAANEKCWTKDSVHGYFGLIPNKWHAADGPLVGDFLRNSIATPATADKTYAYNANNTAELMNAFKAITTSITTGIAAGVVNDPMGENISVTQKPDNFIAGENNGYTWTLSGATGVPQGDKVVYTYVLSYYVKLDTTGAGFDENKYYPTNGVTTFTSGENKYKFPVPAVKGTIPSFNVSYEYTGTVPTGAHEVPPAATAKQNSTVTVAAAPELDGYVFSGWATADAEVNNGTFTMPGKDVKLTGSWQPRGDLSYTVNYYWNGTTTPVANSKTVENVTFGTNITTEAPIAVEGYTAVPGQTCNLTIGTDESKNVIDFYYYKNVDLVANGDTVTYNGEEHSVSGFTGAPEDADFSNISVGAKGTEVGEYNAAFTKSTTSTVDMTKKYIVASATDGKLTITPIDAVVVTITGNTDTKPYNGSEQSVAGYEFESSNPLYTANCFNYNGDAIAHGTDAGSYAMGLDAERFTNTSTNFTNVKFVVTDGSLTIDKIDATFTGESKTVTYTGSEQSITGITPTGLIDGHTYEGLTYAAKGTNVGEYKGEFSGTAVIKDAAGNDVTKNYNVKTTPGKLTINKAEIAVTFTGESKTVPYTGSEQSITGITAEGLLEGHTYAGLTYLAKGTDAGTYDGAFTGTVAIKDANGVDVTENYKVKTEIGKLTISPITDKVTVTITGNTDTKPYNGTTQTVTGYTFSSDNELYTADRVSFTGNATAAGITAGQYYMNLKPEHFSNKDTTNFTNVEFVVNDGWLKITPLGALVITANDADKPYDGTPLTESGFTYVGTLNKGDTIEAVVEGTITDAGEAANVVKSYKIMHGDVDVTAGYDAAALENGTLTVTPRSVIMTSANAEKPYDGEPLTNNTVNVTGDGFIEGEGATYAVTGTQTDAGESDNTFTYTLKDNTKADNYKIELVPGKLKVTPISDKVTVTITGNTDTKPYNGEKQSVKDYKVEISNTLYTENCFSFTGSAVAEGTDAGIYMMGLKAEQFKNTSKNFTNVEFAVADGSLTINKIDATFTGESKTVTYTGSEQSITAITAKGLLNGHTDKGLTYAAKGTNVGEYDGKFTGTVVIKDAAGNDVTKNYNVITTPGKLTISKAEIAVTFTGESKTVPYNGSEQSITGITPTGLLEGHTYSGLAYIAKGTDAGAYDGAFTGEVVIKDANGTDVTENYAVTKTPGKLTIDPISDKVTVTITGNTDTKPYNGEKQSVKDYEVEISNKLYTENCFSFTGSAVAKGTDAGTYEMGLKAEQFKNTSNNFTNVVFAVTDGKLEISQRSVIMTSASDEKFFDGEPLTNDTVTVTGDGFIEGEGASYDVTGTQTKTGESDNTFRYKLNDNTKADNYKIEVAFGKLVVKQLLEKEEHFNYVVGYPDGTIRPEGKITRAEVAAIFFRLLTDDARAEFDCRDNDFTDVEDGAWYNRSISTLAKAGILSGYLDGTFKPNAAITRAEMASIIARFDKLTETGKTFNDIEGHWAQKYIELAATKGWLSGDGDGNFRPNDNIKRDETFAMINRVLERQVETVKDLLPQSEMNMWIDNMDEGAWYYKDVQEATNYHKCERIDQSIYEKWTAKIPDIDWVTHQF